MPNFRRRIRDHERLVETLRARLVSTQLSPCSPAPCATGAAAPDHSHIML
jgi:hypothetical protein